MIHFYQSHFVLDSDFQIEKRLKKEYELDIRLILIDVNYH